MAGQYLVWGLASVLLVVAVVFATVGLRRRIQRGGPAKFSIGIGLVDVIEGLTGKELSPATQRAIFVAALVVAALLLVAGLAFVLVRQGGAS